VRDAADNMGKQTGGWTISWQGTGNSNEDFPGASTILDGIEAAVNAGGGKVLYSADGADVEKADVVIAVYGENPYAEMHGDIATLEYQPGNKVDLALLKKFKNSGTPVVSVFVSGRPLWVNPELNQSDAFVAAWLPGSEGQAIADVLFTTNDGEINFDFSGKLPFTWPKTPSQQLNYHGADSVDDSYDPLFAWGYGLSYDANSTLGDQLSEAGMAPSPASADTVVLYDGEPQVPWQLFLQEEGDNSIKIRSAEQSGLFHTIQVATATERPDYRTIHWTGEREAKVYLAVNSPMDFSGYMESGVVQFDVRVDQPLDSTISLAMSCGDDCGSRLHVNDMLEPLQTDSWETVSVAINCFDDANMKFDQVLTGFALYSDGEADLSFGEVSLHRNGADSATLNCQQ